MFNGYQAYRCGASEHMIAKLISIKRTAGKSGACAPKRDELTSADLPLLS
jgi:hypothetical protein